MPLLVSDFVSALQAYMRETPENMAADVCLRSDDGESCFLDFDVINSKSENGQRFCVFAPKGKVAFKAKVMRAS